MEDSLIDAGLAAYRSHWPELAEQVRLKKFGPARPADFRERSRQMRFLQQRGFAGEQIDALFRSRD
jgi:regulatory protein